jgi:acyl carrier protein
MDPFTEALVEWLNRRLAPPGVVIGPDTPLFADRLIDSIRILELIAWTEREIGRVIPDSMIRMDHFATARRIGEVFASGMAGVPG